MDKMFLGMFITGSYDSYQEHDIFVTADESKAKNWVESGKDLVKKASRIKIPQWDYNKMRPEAGTKSWQEFQEKVKAATEKRRNILGNFQDLEPYVDSPDAVEFRYRSIEVW